MAIRIEEIGISLLTEVPTTEAIRTEEVGISLLTESTTLIANFYGTPTNGLKPLTVQFYDTSTEGVVASWLWNFGDDSTSTEENPSHTYEDGGTFTVSLTVTNVYGSSTKTETDYITVRVHLANNIPDYDVNDLSFGPGIIYIGVEGTTPATDIGAVNEGMELEHSIESLDVEQGNPRELIEGFRMEEMVNFTFIGFEWNVDNLGKFLGSDEGSGDTFRYGGNLLPISLSLRLVHQMPPASGKIIGSTIIIDIWKARSEEDLEIDFGMDLHDFPVSVDAEYSATDWAGNILSDGQHYYKMQIQKAP